MNLMPRILKIRKGDVWIVQLSLTTTNSIGHEIMKTRPCIVYKVNEFVHMYTIIPLTSTLKIGNLPHTLTIKPSQNNGLTKKSIAMIFQLRSLSFKRFKSKIGTISCENMIRIKNVLIDYFDL